MKNLLIIGAGGFGHDIYNLAICCSGYGRDYQIKGFLDDNKDSILVNNCYPPILDSIKDYVVENDDLFICAIGDIQTKMKCVHMIVDKGGEFTTLIHPAAHIAISAKIGIGCIVLQNAVLGSESVIGNFVLIQISTIIGHDARIGNYSRVDCHAVCVGGVVVEDEVAIHTSAIINHNVIVGKRAVVGAASFVIRKVKENTTVYGNPAIKLK